jgi:hypothetical protein
MNIFGKTLMGATAATALAVAAPAQARDNDRVDAGDVIAGVLILGGIAAIAAAASDNDDNRYERRDTRYDRRDTRYDNNNRRHRNQYGQRQQMRPRQAVNQCSQAARQQASRYGRAQVTEITEVDRQRDGYRIEGRLLVNEGRQGRRGRGHYRSANYDQGRFSCRVRYGQVERVRVRGLN